MSESKGSSDEAIGRPEDWREGRYQQPGKPVNDTVRAPTNGRDQPAEVVSTPVTQADYE